MLMNNDCACPFRLPNETGLKMESGLGALVAIISDVTSAVVQGRPSNSRHAQRSENNGRRLISGQVFRAIFIKCCQKNIMLRANKFIDEHV